MSTQIGPKEGRIKECLQRELSPLHIEIVNESYMHNVPKGSESHFKVLVVSEKFETLKSLVQRHRMVNKIIQEELKDEFPHALSIIAKDPKEFSSEYKLEPSPNCKGGFGK
jgi:stress-induced morphogen